MWGRNWGVDRCWRGGQDCHIPSCLEHMCVFMGEGDSVGCCSLHSELSGEAEPHPGWQGHPLGVQIL